MVEHILQAFQRWRQIRGECPLLGELHCRLVKICWRVGKQALNVRGGLGGCVSLVHASLKRIAVDLLASAGQLGVQLHAVHHTLEELVLSHQGAARQCDGCAVIIQPFAKPCLWALASHALQCLAHALLQATLVLNLGHHVAWSLGLPSSAGQLQALSDAVAQRLHHRQRFIKCDLVISRAGDKRLPAAHTVRQHIAIEAGHHALWDLIQTKQCVADDVLGVRHRRGQQAVDVSREPDVLDTREH